MDRIDQPNAIRTGEELDNKRLKSFLKRAIDGLEGDLVVEQFPSGHSNLTYLISVGNREMVLRRPPFGTKAKTAHDMGREYRVLSALKDVYPYTPRPLAFTEDESVIGCPFYIMERVKGIIPRKNFPPGLEFTPDEARKLCLELLGVFRELHAIDYRAIGLENFGKPEGYVKRQVLGWNKRFRAARTPDVPACESVMDWLEANMPPDTDRPCIIHNDYRFDNVVLDPENPFKIIGVLDWEMATIGDPLMDLGGCLAYWITSEDPEELQLLRVQPTNLEGMLTREEIAAAYAEITGMKIDHYEFYYAFGLFRLAVIAQQIYYRYFHGQTRDDRFKGFGMVVAVLNKTAKKVLGIH